MRQDLLWWNTFLPLFNGVSVITPDEWSFANLRFSTDACMVRGGATCLDKCITFAFPDPVISVATHISALELFTIVVAVKFWAPVLQHQRFIISCDNEAAVTVINSGSTRDPFMQRCLRELWFLSALHDFDIRARHIPGEHNSLADTLSRWDLTLRIKFTLLKLLKNSGSVTFSTRYPETSSFLMLIDLFRMHFQLVSHLYFFFSLVFRVCHQYTNFRCLCSASPSSRLCRSYSSEHSVSCSRVY